MNWDVKFELPFTDFNEKYQFDLVVKKDDKTITAKVKPDLAVDSICDVLKHVLA